MTKLVLNYALAILLALSAIATASADSRKGEEVVSSATSMIACTIYCSFLGPVGSLIALGSSATISHNAEESRRKIAQIILNETQDYYQSGITSDILSLMIQNINTDNPNLSESEALDLLNEFAATNI
jgi:hypothetical protein